MDEKTKALLEKATAIAVPEVIGQGDGASEAAEMITALRMAVLEHDKRARHAEQERDLHSQRIAELENDHQLLDLRKREYAAAAAYYDALERIPGATDEEVAKLKTEMDKAMAPFADNQGLVVILERERMVMEAKRPAVNKRIAELEQHIAKLESLGPWLEANRLAQLKWADEARQRGDVNHREQCMILEARADAFKQAGDEFSNRTGKDFRRKTA